MKYIQIQTGSYTISQYKIIQTLLWYNSDRVAVIVQKPQGALDYYKYRNGITPVLS